MAVHKQHSTQAERTPAAGSTAHTDDSPGQHLRVPRHRHLTAQQLRHLVEGQLATGGVGGGELRGGGGVVGVVLGCVGLEWAKVGLWGLGCGGWVVGVGLWIGLQGFEDH